MNAITSAVSKSYDTLLRSYYSKGKNARREEFRYTYSKNELMELDSDAVKKAAKSFRDMEYSSENGSNVYNNIKAFVTSYNNLISSSGGSVDYSVSHTAKLLRNVTKDQKDALSQIGIEILSSGKLSINKDTLAEANPKQIKKLLGEDSDLMNSLRFYANKMYKTASRLNLATPRKTTSTVKKNTTTNDGATESDVSGINVLL